MKGIRLSVSAQRGQRLILWRTKAFDRSCTKLANMKRMPEPPPPETVLFMRTRSGGARPVHVLEGAEFRTSIYTGTDVLFYVAGRGSRMGGTKASAEEAAANFRALSGEEPVWCMAVDTFDRDEGVLDGFVVNL